MPIVTSDQNTSDQKKFLTKEELKTLNDLQSKTQSLILELGEIEMIKIQTEKRHKGARLFLEELENLEKELTESIFEKYGKSNINPETGEITKLD
tara:strand:- start:380 stop:664 length:285 start_codon:yes stop_codon:yes gene_type:complete